MSDQETSPKKMKSILKGLWWRLPLFFVAIIVVFGLFSGPSGLPACDSSNAKDTLSKAFNQSQFARNLGLSAIEITQNTELQSSTEKKKACFAQVTLNNATTVPVLYQMALRDNGAFMLTFEVQE